MIEPRLSHIDLMPTLDDLQSDPHERVDMSGEEPKEAVRTSMRRGVLFGFALDLL